MSQFLIIVLIAAFILDVFIGEPLYFLHPVRIIGYFVKIGEKILRKGYLGGIIIISVIPVLVSAAVALSLYLSMENFYIYMAVNIFWVYSAVSLKGLYKAGTKILYALKSHRLESAQKNLSGLVSRDTESMNETQLVSSTIESIAENLVDGFTAPLFYYCIAGPLGPVLMWYYKTVNTCDSMIGYKNDEYSKFNYCTAKLDDILNWIPARITLIIIALASLLPGFSAKFAVFTAYRDAGNDDSPNSGIPESAFSGSLMIKLGGEAVYHGETVYKKPFGAKFREPFSGDIFRSLILMWASGLTALFLTVFFIFFLKIDLIFLNKLLNNLFEWFSLKI